MKLVIGIVAAAALVVGLVAPMSMAQRHEHQMIKPADLKWSAVPSLPAGAEIDEGKMSEVERVTAFTCMASADEVLPT
jgi:hypothetical protein